MGAASYVSRAMDDNAVRVPTRTARPRPDAAVWRGLSLGRFARRRGAGGGVEARAAAVCRGGDRVVAAERLGELGRLAVAHAMGHLAHRQAPAREHLGGALHADRGEVVAE